MQAWCHACDRVGRAPVATKAAGMKCHSPLKLHSRFVDVPARVSAPFSTSTISSLLGIMLTTPPPSTHGLVANEQVGAARVSLITAVCFVTHATGCLLKFEPACSENGFGVWLQRRVHTYAFVSCFIKDKRRAREQNFVPPPRRRRPRTRGDSSYRPRISRAWTAAAFFQPPRTL